jgi:alpha-1,3-mannosyltransferase
MNILLFLPGYFLILMHRMNPIQVLFQAVIMLAIQMILAAPFLSCNASAYLSRAFDFHRRFVYKWSVNWQFIPESLFLLPSFSRCLLILHCSLLLLFLWRHNQIPLRQYIQATKLVRNIKQVFSIKPCYANFQPAQRQTVSFEWILTVFFGSNMIGIFCSRSLHYQFYLWYFYSLPFLLFQAAQFIPHPACQFAFSCVLWLAIESCWQLYPPTASSSFILFALHSLIVIRLLLLPKNK